MNGNSLPSPVRRGYTKDRTLEGSGVSPRLSDGDRTTVMRTHLLNIKPLPSDVSNDLVISHILVVIKLGMSISKETVFDNEEITDSTVTVRYT